MPSSDYIVKAVLLSPVVQAVKDWKPGVPVPNEADGACCTADAGLRLGALGCKKVIAPG